MSQPSSPKAGPTRGRMSRRKSAGPVPYDFRRPTKLSREHVRTLQIAYETFARQYATVLTSTLRVVSQVTLISIEQLTYDEYITALENPTVMAMVEMEPLSGINIFEFSLSTALVCVDHMLGGPGGKQPQRPLTDIETPLIQGLLTRVLAELRYAYEPITEIRPKLGSIEYNPQFVQAAGSSDAMIVASFEMRVGTEECVATICMPFGPLFSKLQGDGLGSTLTDAQRQAKEAALRNMTAGLSNTPIDISVRFDPVTLTASELVMLRPGDVVPLGHPVTAPLAVTSAGITFAHAVPGSSGRRLACLVVPTPKEDDR
ncbi:flagellar motor switch protein FliM [Virgisporangium aliadipatigenens]|uniref:Flagellar motor switch protein FliM n=2 Tax=Virgisporangium aliadipatigenens TaxID=741659 RepID=A0A8J4DS01_9ACTN|nr:flagellar motor switch protein FliM [Virgisporangium aliadipatigenens]